MGKLLIKLAVTMASTAITTVGWIFTVKFTESLSQEINKKFK